MLSDLSDTSLANFRIWVSWFAVMGSSIGVICAILMIAATKETSRRDAVRAAELQSRLQTAQDDTRAAKELAEQARQASLPRTLGTVQREILVRSLRSIPNGRVVVKANMFDTEAESYARNISAALTEAGINIGDLPYSGIVSLNDPGIFLLVMDLSNPPPQAVPIQKVFANAGISILASKAQHAEFPKDMVVIWISRKEAGLSQ